MRQRLLALATLMCCALPAQAQDASALSERLDRLERDVTFVQKQVYRNGSTGGGEGGVPMNSGQLQVRFSQIDEEMRQIRGLIEQTQFQNKQIANDVKRLSDDVDYRLRAIEQKQASMDAASAAPAPAPATASPFASDPASEAAPPAHEPESPATYKPDPKAKTAEKPVEKPAVTGKDFPDANAHYSHAFKLLNEKKFAEAATSFDGFVKKYPADPLTANAFYWLGESQYARSDFTRSTESFRKGFEVNPDGQKAPDNLYKLALSLAQIKRKTEACVVLSQVISKYGATAARTAAKASEARTTFECK